MKTTNLRIPDNIHELVRTMALIAHKSINSLIVEALLDKQQEWEREVRLYHQREAKRDEKTRTGAKEL